MDPDPLLANQSETAGSGWALRLALCPLECFARIRNYIRFWWSVTANPDYLASWASRRNLWKLIFPLSVLQFVVAGAFDNRAGQLELGQPLAQWLLTRSCITAVVFLMPTRQIWSDLIVVGAYVGMLHLPADVNLSVLAIWASILLSFVGCHSYSISLYILGLNCMGMYYGKLRAEQALVSFSMLPVLFVVEFRLASVFFDLQQKSKSLEMLLDKATDGFCTVDGSTGIFRGASPKLAKTFGVSGNLVGKRVYDFVQKSDHSAIQAVLQLPSGVQETNPALVTCMQEKNSLKSPAWPAFDVKIIPFAESAHTIQICLQVQGETRMARQGSETRSEPAKGDVWESEGKWIRSPSDESLTSQSPSRKELSEASWTYSVTESGLSSSTRKRIPETGLLFASSSSQLTRKDAAVQTDELQRPPLLPGSSSRPLSRSLSRGRSPVPRQRLSSKPKSPRSQAQEGQSSAQSLQMRTIDEQGNDQQALTFASGRRSPGRRKRLGQDVNQMQD